MLIDLLVVSVVSYLAGAVPYSYLAGKLFAGIDLRDHGSGNLGASNTFRLLGARVALGVLIFDIAKGFLPVFFAPVYTPMGALPDHWLMLVAAFCAPLGHMFSIFVGFKGGKGIATTAGAFLALTPIVLLVTFAIFAIVFATKRIVSLGSIVGAIALPIVVFVLDKTGVSPSHWSLQAVSIAITIVVLVKHKSNMKRLIAGEEPSLQRTKGSYGG